MATKEFEIKIPANANDLRIRHFGVLKLDMETITEIGLIGQMKFINTLTGTSVSNLKMLSQKQLKKVYASCMLPFMGFKVNAEPPNEIVMDGVIYELINPERVGTGWHIDMGMASTLNWQEKDPVKLACLFYHPKGKAYGEVDENENLLIPISSKEKVFEEHFPLRTYVECLGFFLRKSERLMRNYTEQKKAENKVAKIIARMSGMKSLRWLLKTSTMEIETKQQ